MLKSGIFKPAVFNPFQADADTWVIHNLALSFSENEAQSPSYFNRTSKLSSL
jgi:hypothetical protein